MKTKMLRTPKLIARGASVAAAASIIAPTLVGCGGPQPSAPPPRNGQLPPPVNNAPRASGLTTGQKVALLAGAAALYYMYKKKQNAQGQAVQYHRSESNGRIYYRDPQTHQPIWVSPPQGGIRVPANEAQQYSDYQGYNNQPTGETFGGWGANRPLGNSQPSY